MKPYKLIIDESTPEPMQVQNPGFVFAVVIVAVRYESNRLQHSARILDKDGDELFRLHGIEKPRTYIIEQPIPLHFPIQIHDDDPSGGNRILVWGYLLDNPPKNGVL